MKKSLIFIIGTVVGVFSTYFFYINEVEINYSMKKQVSKNLISCNLSSEALQQRDGELQKLFKQCTKIEELEDGYAFQFPRTQKMANELLQFVFFEQQCCHFLTFELIFAEANKDLSLRLRGSHKVKEFIKPWLNKSPNE
ncbi:hypothetical protein [Candidatus Uabimicrobium sp. HlEnr_7]|uniref:hypothetical protein n=1 Tax=Candidatus Uabimicrobium helgolandensis TaxID=3095367 RepID=UPI00355900A7